jgi:peroxiredoxin
MAAINSPAPDFLLGGIDGHKYRLEKYRGSIVILCFWSAKCPTSDRVDQALRQWPEALSSEAEIFRIASNADESEKEILEEARKRFDDSVLLDPGHQVADLYQAKITPEFFLIDREGILRYHGGFDDATFRHRLAQHQYLEGALRSVLAGQTPNPAETSVSGCTIVRY